MAIRERERDAMLANEELCDFRGVLTEARKFSEGYHLQFLVESQTSYVQLETFLVVLIRQRRDD